MSFGLGNSFRIRFIERTGQSRVAAKSVSLSMSKRICESELALGAVSSTGELSWDTIVDKWNRSRCSAGKGRKVVVRSIGQAFGKSPRRLATPFHGSYKKYRNASRWFMTSRVFGLNDRYLLIGKRKGTVELVNRATGTRQTRTGLPATWEDYPETILASDGSSIGSTRVRSTANGAPIAHEVPLLYSQAGIRTELQPYSPGANSRAIFCGDRIVQLTTYTKTSAAVIVRDLNGAVTATLQHPEEPWPGEVDDFECDAHTVVFQVTVGQEEDLANYAFDL
jgi:hypothetical protein